MMWCSVKKILIRIKRKRILISCILLGVVCMCGVAFTKIHKQKKMTVDESVQQLMNYIYGEDYLSLCIKYCSKEDKPLLTVYNSEWVRYPIYEFEIPDDQSSIRRQIFCVGETKNREYLIMGVFSWKYYIDNGERFYMGPKFLSRYAVNRITKEIIQERYQVDGWWIYNEEFESFIQNNKIVLE